MKKYDPTASITDIVDCIGFGPVTSRRGVRSLGVNILPHGKKVCSFDCAYCMLGRTQAHSGKEAGAWASIDSVEEGLIEASEFLRKIKRLRSICTIGYEPPNANRGFSNLEWIIIW